MKPLKYLALIAPWQAAAHPGHQAGTADEAAAALFNGGYWLVPAILCLTVLILAVGSKAVRVRKRK